MNEMRIYVASLSDYNNGRLEGKWLDLSDYSDASELMEAIQEMLDELTEKYKSVDGEVREEFAVHDYEGIPSTLASEYMGEQDFQQLYDIAEVADDRGVPVEVLIERAGDTGSDDYQALADSLIMVIDGNDESDIVAEYENQIGELGFDWWSNHVGITKTDQRLLYGEDVDNFKEEILAENPDMDESEAEGQAEERADDEQEQRNSDLIGYLQERGYEDEFPNWVYKDYQDAWENDLSYEFDVIHHDGEMYVFTNNYSLGGTILSGVIGAYIGYKVGRSKPQKKGFETEKRIGRKIKGALTKKKMAKGGLLGASAQLEFIDEAYASYELQDELRKRLGLDENANSVGDNVVISFAYTDYGGDFLDKVAIAYFQENYPENTIVENAGYNGENAFVFGEPAQEWIDYTDDYPLGMKGLEDFYYEILNESEEESFSYFLDDLERDYTFDREELMTWLIDNRSGYYSMTTQGLDISYSDLTNNLIREGLISKEDEDEDDEEYARGGGIKDVIVYDNGGESFDRYTIFTPDGSVFGMSDNALMPNGFNMYIGDNTEIKKGSHLGKKLKSVPESIKIAVERRMSEEYAEGGSVDEDIQFAVVIKKDDKNYNKIGYSKLTEFITDKQGNEFDKLYFEGKKLPKKYNAEDLNYSVRELDTFTSSTGDRKFILLKELTDDNRIYYYILHYDDKKVYAESYDMNFIKSELKRLTNGKNFYSKAGVNFGEGGEVEDFSEFDFQVGDKLDLGSKGIKYFKQYDGEKIIVVDSKSDLKTSKGTSTYPSSVKKVLNRKYAKGGGIGFKGLSSKVAKRYEGKSVAPKYQSQYGTTYSKSEAKEVGDKVAGKVYWNQQGRKMENGGGVGGKKYYMVFNLSEFKEKPMYNHIATSKQEVLDILLESYKSIVGHKMYVNGYTIKDMDESDYNKWGVYINDDYAYVTANPRNFDTSNTISWQQQGRKMAEGGGVQKEAEYVTTILGNDPSEDEGYWDNYQNASYEDLNPMFGRYAGYKWISMQGEEGYWEKDEFAKGGEVNNKKEWIAIYSRGNGQQIVVVKAKDKSEAYREAEMSRGNYKLGSDWQMIDIYESQYAKGGGISGLDDLLRG